MIKPAHLLIERAGARVVLEGSLTLLQEVATHCHPHYVTKPIIAVPAGVWIVSALDADAKRPNTECFQSAVRSEPTRFVFHDLNAKLLTLATESPRWLPIFCCRLIRDLLRWQLLESGELFFQAGLVKIGDSGIAFVGPPRSGKTTTALALVGREGGTFVADNDLCVTGKTQGLVSGMGWPRSICIRTNTLSILKEWWPNFSNEMGSFAHPNNHHGKPEAREFLYILPDEMATLTKKPILTETPVSCLIFPEFSDARDAKPELVRLSNEQAAKKLTASWDFLAERKVGQRSGFAFTGKQNWALMCFNPFLVEAFSIPEPDQLLAEVHQLAALIPCYKLIQQLSQVQESSRIIMAEIAQDCAFRHQSTRNRCESLHRELSSPR